MPPPRLPPRQEIFVNREGPLARFDAAVETLPADSACLLVFHGVGGQGKTALLRHIHDRCRQDPGRSHLRVGMLDLHGRREIDPDLMPVRIRNAFAAAGVAFPAFDIGLAVWWEASQRVEAFPNLANAWLSANKDDLAGTAQETVQSLGELAWEEIGSLPGGSLLKRGAKWLIDKHRRRYLEQARPHLQDMPAEPWLMAERLPWLLAQDLNHHLSQHPTERFVLLTDEYESLFEGRDSDGRWRDNGFDRRMRAFIQETDGLLAVFGSRRLLPWGEDPDWRDDVAAGDCPLEGLKDPDAESWLTQAGVADPGLCTAMREGAREEKRAAALVYPLLLELQVAHWQSLTARGAAFGPEEFRVQAEGFEGRCHELTERLLRGYGESLAATLKRLSVANRFDRAAFERVVRQFQTGVPLDRFETLANLSLIAEAEAGWLTLHRAVADAIAETLSDAMRQETVETLLAHFEARATVERGLDVTDATVAALFEAAHLRRQLRAEGYTDWLFPLYDKLRENARYGACEQLWRDALTFCEEELGPEHPSTAASYNNVACNLDDQGRYGEAEPLYRRALDICERVLGPEHPSTATSCNNVASNLNAQGRYGDAEPLYRRALDLHERVLGPEHPSTATSCNNVAYNLFLHGRLAEAEPYLRRAVEIVERRLGPEHPTTRLYRQNLEVLEQRLRASGGG